jgi:hypothetical protein
LNRKYLLLFIILLSIFVISIFLKKNNILIINASQKILPKESKYDILNPNFVMNKTKEQIKVTANKGNFVGKSEILLKENVVFKSEKFMIYSDNVIFDKEKQTAKSSVGSIFISEKTKIQAEGFKIVEQGEKIVFDGKTILTLDK